MQATHAAEGKALNAFIERCSGRTSDLVVASKSRLPILLVEIFW